MREYIAWFNQVLTVAIQLYFQQDTEYTRLEEVRPPVNGWLEKVTGVSDMTFGEQVIIMLALMPHVCPQVLDIFLCRTKLRPAVHRVRWLERAVAWRFSAHR